MENASKALIIAGAILLAIVIISLGLIVVNNTRSTIDNANLSEQEIQNFNAKFTAYAGDKVSASRVNTLIQQVISTNQATYDSGKSNFICISYPSADHVGDTTSGEYIAIGFCTKATSSTNQKVNGIGYAGQQKTVIDPITKQSNINNASGSSTPTGMSAVATGKNYKVTMVYVESTGLIGGIKVENITP